MPTIDLHRHLEGSIRPSTALALARKHQHWLAADSRPLHRLVAPVRTAGLLDYLERIDVACSTARAVEDWSLIAQQAVQDCFDEGLDYAEIRFSPWFIHTQTGLDPAEVIDAITDAARDASALLNLPVAFIGIIVRDLGPDTAMRQMNTILSRSGRFCGVDLAGDEAGYPPALFTPAFARAHDAGLRVTAHAGEAAGPDSVRAALQALRPDRIGHGVRAAEDPRLMEQLADAGITLEVALTSNVQTRAAASLREHPIKRLLQAGVPVSLNTDNPTPSATGVAAEFRRAATEVGLSEAQLQLIVRDSAAAAFTEAGRQLARTRSAADN
ncbi:adenosine deaminase [Streptomyces sp. NPDC056835]|uniref:adenosine deaminase n=1 Tax=Streptomyces sp. NPDC056835 TaxID=3345956 RepID=UPI0036C3048D